MAWHAAPAEPQVPHVALQALLLPIHRLPEPRSREAEKPGGGLETATSTDAASTHGEEPEFMVDPQGKRRKEAQRLPLWEKRPDLSLPPLVGGLERCAG